MTESTEAFANRLRGKFGVAPQHHIIHMPGEKPTRSATDIEIHLTLDEHFFRAFVPSHYVDSLVRSWDDILAFAKKEHPKNVRSSNRDTTKDILRDLLVEDRHVKAYIPDEPGNGPAIMAAAVLWMIFSPTNLSLKSSASVNRAWLATTSRSSAIIPTIGDR
jgi:hypothetical protein